MKITSFMFIIKITINKQVGNKYIKRRTLKVYKDGT